jgi:DNA-binding FadR family transcriptional regulator
MVDRAALAEALQKGDANALKSVMARLLSTAEGQRLSAEVQKMLQGQGHG